ncbi:hypothetical protein ACWEOE_10740 [Amycolatopsis sp. NPDC004368]
MTDHNVNPDTWAALLDILGVPGNLPADDVLNLVRGLVAKRTEASEQLLFDAVPEDIPRAELDRRIVLALRHLHYSACGHTGTAFVILRDGVEPAEPSRCVLKRGIA